MEGFVYLLKEDGDDLMYKIGVTCAKNIETRVKKLQTGNGNKIRLVEYFKTKEPFKLEKMLHNYFSLDRQEGEWFLLNNNQRNQFTQLCEKFDKIVNYLKQENPYF